MDPRQLTSDRTALRARRLLATLLVVAAYTLLAFGLNEARGATASGFGSFDDEPSHVVTGLMFRDYFAAGMPGSPRAFAEQYYVHYPKVGIGQWPPVFYALQGAWLLAFGASATALVALMSLLTAGLATCVFGVLRGTLGTPSALLMGALVCVLPLVQRMGSVVMTELPLALFCLLAALELARFLDGARARHAFGFAFFAILAILTKGNALALGLLPAIAIALAGKWSALRRPALWGAGALVALVCAPWYWLTLSISASTWAGGSTPNLGYAARAGTFYTTGLAGLGGVLVTACAVVGMAVRPAEGAARCRWATTIGLILALLAFHVAIPSSIELRHLALVAAPWVLCTAWGAAWLARRRSVATLGLGAFVPALVVATFFVESFDVPPKDNHGYRHAIARIESDARLEKAHVLIASDSQGEGLFVAAGALADERPGRVYLRATKVLGSSTWMGDDYQPAFASVAAMGTYLAELPVGVVALDLSTREHQWFEHMDMLRELLESGENWEPIAVFDVFRDGIHHPGALRLYRQRGHDARPQRELDFQTLYNRTL